MALLTLLLAVEDIIGVVVEIAHTKEVAFELGALDLRLKILFRSLRILVQICGSLE